MSDQVLTTQTTASTGVAAPMGVPRTYDVLGVAELVLGGIVSVVVFLGSIIAIANTVRGWVRDRRGDERDHASEQRAATLEGQRTILARMDENKGELRRIIEERTSGLEQRVAKIEREYRSQTELDRDYGRLHAGQEQLERTMREQAERITAGERAQARLEALQESTASQVSEVKQAVDRLGERIDDRFDKLMDSISARFAS